MTASRTASLLLLPAIVMTPSGVILSVPEDGAPPPPLLVCVDPVKLPSAATVIVPRNHHGAPGPDARLFSCHVPTRSERL